MVSMRPFKILGLAILLSAGLFSSSAQGALIAPGGVLFPAPGEPDPVGGTVLQSVTVPFVAVDFSGALTSRVISGDTSNALGGLTFTYQLTNTDADGSPTDINRLTAVNYTTFLTDASYQTGSGLNPTLINRGLPPAGAEMGFEFLPVIGQGGLAPGQTSAVLVVQTNATFWAPSFASVINGGVASVPSLGPAIPEPTALLGLVMASMGLMHRGRRR